MQNKVKTFVIATVGSRYDGLCVLLKSLERYYRLGWRVGICMQCYKKEDVNSVRNLLSSMNADFTIFEYAEMIGAHPAKVSVMKGLQSDIWCSLDDDMEIISQTDYESMANTLLKDKSIGFLSGNWARTKELSKKKKIQNTYVSQPIVYTGGGLMFRDDIAKRILNIPNEQYLFDDCLWAGYVYADGYSNFRYLGSVAIHNICTVGGRRQWLNENKAQKPLPPEWMFKVRRGTGQKGTMNEFLICSKDDLTDFAKEQHKTNKARRFKTIS